VVKSAITRSLKIHSVYNGAKKLANWLRFDPSDRQFSQCIFFRDVFDSEKKLADNFSAIQVTTPVLLTKRSTVDRSSHEQ